MIERLAYSPHLELSPEENAKRRDMPFAAIVYVALADIGSSPEINERQLHTVWELQTEMFDSLSDDLQKQLIEFMAWRADERKRNAPGEITR